MDDFEKKSLEKQLKYTQRNLNTLREQKSGFGPLSVPPHVLRQIEEAEELEAELLTKLGLKVTPLQNNQVPETPSTNPPVQNDPATTVPIQPPTSGEKPTRTNVFVSYSHKNQDWFDRFKGYIDPLQKRGLVNFWTDKQIRTGQKWDDEIKKGLANAKVAVLMISQEFVNSDYIKDVELKHLLQAAKDENVAILPVIVNPCRLDLIELDGVQAVNSPDKTLIDMSESEWRRTFIKLTNDIEFYLKGQP